MKNKITKNTSFGIVILFLTITNFCFAQTTDIKLIAFNYNEQDGTKIVRWNAGDTQFDTEYSTNVEGIIVASSAFDSKRSNYFARVLDNTSGSVETRIIKFNTNTQNISLTPVQSMFNGGSEVDMQTGFVYTYDGDFNTNTVFLSKYDPISETQTNLGNFAFGEGTNYFPDSTCFDSNSKKYYFLILEDNQVKLVTADVVSQPFTYTVIPVQNTEYAGNIGLEFSNETNTIFTMYTVFNPNNSANNEIIIGSLNPNTGELSTSTTLENIFGYFFSTRTFDQDSESMIFAGLDLNNTAGLYVVNTSTLNYEILELPGDAVNEIECDNSLYAQLKYGSLSVNEFSPNTLKINPNPANSYFQVSFEGNLGDFVITDLLGKAIQSGTLLNNGFVDISNLSSGIYVFNLMSNETTFTQKIVVN